MEEIKALATMPGKEELFSKLLFLINAPAQRLATVINATGRDLAVVINQGVEKEKFNAPNEPRAIAPGNSLAGSAGLGLKASQLSSCFKGFGSRTGGKWRGSGASETSVWVGGREYQFKRILNGENTWRISHSWRIRSLA